MVTATKEREKVAINDQSLVALVAKRLLKLPTEKARRVLELWELYGESEDDTEREEIAEAFVEVIHPALVDIPWEASATGLLEEGVARDTVRKAKAYRKKVGARIRARRLELGMTQQDLADAAGIPQSHVCRIEKGMHVSTDITIKRVAHALKIAPSELDPCYCDY